MERLCKETAALGFVMVMFWPAMAHANDAIERAIYAEQVIGDAERAADLYQDAGTRAGITRDNAAYSLLRRGLCLLKAGRRTQATDTFRMLTTQYPEQAQVLALIPSTPDPKRSPLGSLSSISDDTLVLRKETGPYFATPFVVYRRTLATRRGRRVLHLETFRNAPMTANARRQDWRYVGTRTVPDTLEPLETREAHRFTRTWTTTRYARGTARVIEQVRERRTDATARWTTPLVVAADTIVPLLRLLPLVEGYTVDITYLDTPSATTRSANISVLGRETVTVPAGTFQTFRVRLSSSSWEQEEWWVSEAEPHQLVKVEPAGLELIEAQGRTSGAPIVIRESSIPASWTLPAGWISIPFRHLRDPVIHMLAPRMEALGHLVVAPAGAEGTPEEMVLNQLARSSRMVVRQWTVRTMKINDRPAAEFVADEPGQGRVLYSIFVVGEKQTVHIWFDVLNEQWAAFAPVLRGIAASLKLE